MVSLKDASGLIDNRVAAFAENHEQYGEAVGAVVTPEALRLLFVGMDTDPEEVMVYTAIIVERIREAIEYDADTCSVLLGAIATAIATAMMAVTHDDSA